MIHPQSAIAVLLAATKNAITFVSAQETQESSALSADQLQFAPSLAPPGFNLDGGSVAANFINAFNDKQFFQRWSGNILSEYPDSGVIFIGDMISWCSDLNFSNFLNSSNPMAYTARCVFMPTPSVDMVAFADLHDAEAVATSEELFTTWGLSAVFVEQSNLFEVEIHNNADNLVGRYWDDGRPTMFGHTWATNDAGSSHPNAAMNAFSLVDEATWVSVDEMAESFNVTTSEFTPETFKKVYQEAWSKTHQDEVTEENPKPEAESQVTETEEVEKPGDIPTEPINDGSSGDGGVDAPQDDDPSGTERKLASVSARFVSVALRMFGI